MLLCVSSGQECALTGYFRTGLESLLPTTSNQEVIKTLIKILELMDQRCKVIDHGWSFVFVCKYNNKEIAVMLLALNSSSQECFVSSLSIRDSWRLCLLLSNIFFIHTVNILQHLADNAAASLRWQMVAPVTCDCGLMWVYYESSTDSVQVWLVQVFSHNLENLLTQCNNWIYKINSNLKP